MLVVVSYDVHTGDNSGARRLPESRKPVRTTDNASSIRCSSASWIQNNGHV